ncbi:hypothetical protein MPSEU_000018100 [Mayamaea pseudoterrestris]|nr:hypothetical protein MPSEU_000018100 [Mayamaea pseudoterrestris]
MKRVTLATPSMELVKSSKNNDDDSPDVTKETSKLASMADSLSDSGDSYQQQPPPMQKGAAGSSSMASYMDDKDDDESSSDDDTTEHDDDHDDADDKDESDDQVERMAVSEASRVLKLRFIVYGSVLLIGIILSVSTFGVLKRLALEGKQAEYFGFVHSLNASIAVIEELNAQPLTANDLANGLLPYQTYFQALDMPGVIIILNSSCAKAVTYMLNENGGATLLGEGDLHDPDYDFTQQIFPLEQANDAASKRNCRYSMILYASAMVYAIDSPLLVNFTIGIACGIFAIIVIFRYLDFTSFRGSTKIITAALQANSILTSLFPKIVRDRMIAEQQLQMPLKNAPASNSIMAEMMQGAASVHGTAAEEEGSEFGDGLVHRDKPIADLFPETTIMFADIAGFTAWSSVREPTQVFQLLETLYHAFDKIAKRRRVFKVETIGDCYVAVTGLPQPRRDHAVVMCRFARECLMTMEDKVRMLEQLLGPDTAELKLRAGLHSGPVTAGVLRGERARFQLFGDTMNTASRMESTGLPGQIQVSQETADLLIAAGKVKWFTPRDTKIIAKGKGEMQTYWIAGTEKGDGTVSFSGDSSYASKSEASLPMSIVFDEKEQLAAELAEKQARLVNWCVDVLLRLLKQIVARRNALRRAGKLEESDTNEEELVEYGTLPLDEVVEIIQLPQEYVPEADTDQEKVVLEPAVIDQLHNYVSNVASLYHDNPFHNFEHASHVTMSATKLLSRIVAPHSVLSVDDDDQVPDSDELHDHTFGITSDPITQFSCVLGTLIHDADHCGVPNMQLIKEGRSIAEYYKEKSIAEQNSIDVCWSLLMQPDYADLRRTIFCSQGELQRFRQLLVNAVLATDIMDKGLGAARKERWNLAFAGAIDENPVDTVNRKATIVLEHLIQASDVAHTMQHWHIYRKWNERFFLECHKAWKEGRSENDPSESWYKGEMGFYDFYIIPLAKKLKDCGVFGVASDEYLNYAIRNRKEWEERGQEIVSEMVEIANMQEWSKK